MSSKQRFEQSVRCRFLALPVISALLCFALTACEKQSSQGKAETPADISKWVAKGPDAWAAHLGPEATQIEDGFPALVQLSTWIASNPKPQEEEFDSSEWLAWAQTYSNMVNDITDQSYWSVKPVFGPDIRMGFGKDKPILSITDGQERVMMSQLAGACYAGRPALSIFIREGKLDEAEALALRLFVLGERIGQDGADKDSLIWIMQLAIAAHGAEALVTIADMREDAHAKQRYSQIKDGISEYSDKRFERLRGGP